jgi:hypothetical protein
MAKKKETETTITPTTTTTTTTTTAVSQPNLQIQDIVALLNHVDVASRRGAYPAAEMSDVGATFDRVLTFLKSTGVVGEKTEEQKE